MEHTLLELALMPDYRRNLWLGGLGDARPSQADLDAAWQGFHGQRGGKRIYFVQHGVDGPIKIGLAASPKRRIASLQTACADHLQPLAICPGDAAKEREYHRLFAGLKLKGEWFRPGEAILQEIDRLNGQRWGKASVANLKGAA